MVVSLDVRPRLRTSSLILVTAALGLLGAPPGSAVTSGASPLPVYLDPGRSPAERAADLVSRMTLEEKAAQMNSSQSPAIPRLGIRAYSWWNEASHGVAFAGLVPNENAGPLFNTTSYPVDLAVASTWDQELIHREATMISDEAREVVRENDLDLNFYSPTVNLARDPRWGRNDESFGEDPYLASRLAAAYVNGMEGKDRSGRLLPSGKGFLKTATTLKHYAANNSEVNRLDGDAVMDDRTLREYYTAQFRDAVRLSDPSSIMSSYNRVNGVPAAASTYLMRTLARQTFGFNGFFTSDCDAIRQIEAGHHWQPAGYPHPLDSIERHAFANAAGEDLDCQMGYHDEFNYGNTLPEAVRRGIRTESGLYTEDALDVSLVRLFTTRFRLGEFDDPKTVPWVTAARKRVPAGTWVNSLDSDAVTQTPDRLAMARHAADESIVLLKNAAPRGTAAGAKPLLPLRVPSKGTYRVAVVGQFAKPARINRGGYSSPFGAAGTAKSVDGFTGISNAVHAINPDAVVDFLPGTTTDMTALDEASVTASADYDAVLVYLGTDYTTAREDHDRTTIDPPGVQAQLVSAVAAANPRTVVYMETTGQLNVTGFEAAVPAMLWSSFNGQRKGEALADVLLGRHNPSGHLPFTWYTDDSQLPPVEDYAIRPTNGTLGRTYMYFRGTPSYPFGHGLSYTTFRYSTPRVDHRRVDANGTVRVRVEVTNTGRVAGDDVVQLYVSTPGAPAAAERPSRRLRGFRRVHVPARGHVTVDFRVPVADLAFFDEASGRFRVDRGTYRFEVGSSSARVSGTRVEVRGGLRPVPSVLTLRPRRVDDAATDVPQRVVYPRGVRIAPRPTVAFSDDTLYGALEQGVNRPLPRGMRVTYRSNRSRVVSVEPDGTLLTRGTGVATVTACAAHGGRRVCTETVLLVRDGAPS